MLYTIIMKQSQIAPYACYLTPLVSVV